jgi:hypothetical protein
LVDFLCEEWCLLVFFGAIVPLSGDGAGVDASGVVVAVEGAAGVGLGAGVFWAKAGAAANSAVARKAVLIRGSFIGSPYILLLG